MELRFSDRFQKQYKKLPHTMRDTFKERLELFVADPTHPMLRVHPLRGAHVGYWSMNVTGDVRALYGYDGAEVIMFVLIGTHSQLYG